VPVGKESAGCGMESFGITLTGDTGIVESGGIDGMTGLVESCEKELTEFMNSIQTVKIPVREIFILVKRN
jgi:hypothetical protein